MNKNKLLFFALMLLSNTFSYAQEIVNGGFEMLNNRSIPRNWAIYSNNGSVIGIDSVTKHSGRYAIKINAASVNATVVEKQPVIFANTYGATSDKKLKTIEVNAWIKVSAKADSAAALFIQDIGGEKIVRVYSKHETPDTQWQKLTIKFTADSSKAWYGFYYGVEVGKPALIWFDDISIKIDGKQISDPLSTSFEPKPANLQWLNNNLSRLRSVDIVPDHSDLIPIGNLCNHAQIVGIGEPTHGTSEALKFKLRLLEYLVTKKGFNTIALEEVVPSCDLMNAFINNPETSIKDSLINSSFYKLWKSEEIYAMLAWVRKYNSTHLQKVNFIGMDMEDIRIKTSRKMLREYGKHNESIATQVKMIDISLDTLLKANAGDEVHIHQLAGNLKMQLAAMYPILKSPKSHIESDEELFRLQSYVRVCEQWLSTRFYTGQRDNLMADNIAFYVKHHPGNKIMVWAHNFHVANDAAARTMGAYLKTLFGKAYVPIGFTSAGGTYTAAIDNTQKIWNTFKLEPAYKGSYEYILSKATNNFFFLPLNNEASKAKAAFWLDIPMKHLDIGYIHVETEDDYKFYGNLSKVFDGLVFYKKTTANSLHLKSK
jgi:erythromycin esterase